jgi:hypothetical protein
MLALALAVGAAVLIVPFVALPRLPDPQAGDSPRVQIRLPSHGARVPVAEHQLVLLQAYKVESVARYELWVDGSLAAYDLPAAGEVGLPLSSRMPWHPGEPGLYTLVGRAYDAEGRAGTSVPVVVEAVATAIAGLVNIEVLVQEGDTIESIAEEYGSTPEWIREANPGLTEPLEPGTTVFVPVPPDRVPPEYVAEEGEEAEPADEEGLPPPPLPQGQGEGPAQPAEQAEPSELPWDFGPSAGAPPPPAAPVGLEASHGGDCTVRLRWTDVADSETGFRIYRLSAASGDFRRVAQVEANQDLAILVYDDVVPLGGPYQYTVAAVNAGGESPGPIAVVDVPRDACSISAPLMEGQAAAWLQFEATSLNTFSQFDGVYCYLSLAKLQPHSRLPEDDDSELAPREGGWNISVHASGLRRFTFIQDPEAPVPVEFECWGRRGREHTSLGEFRASHPAEEWDGRSLTGEGEGFRLTYHIEPFSNERPDQGYIALDLSIPRPTDVRIARGFAECATRTYYPGNAMLPREGPLALWACQEIWEQMLVWDWSPGGVSRRDIDGFRVYVSDITPPSEPGVLHGATVIEVGEVGSVLQVFPVPLPSCWQRYAYTVQAFISDDRAGEIGPRESLRSEPLVLDGPMCPSTMVEFTLEELETGWTDDGIIFTPWPEEDEILEGFGRGLVRMIGEDGSEREGPWFYFWSVRQMAGIFEGYLGPSYRSIGPYETYDLAEEDLAICPGNCQLGPGNNSVVLTVNDGDTIDFAFRLLDDDMEPDVWCGTEEDMGIFLATVGDVEEKRFRIGPYSTDEWSEMHTVYQFDNTGEALSDHDARCYLRVRVRGVGRTP